MLTVRGAGGLPVAAITPGYSETVIYYHHDVPGTSVASGVAGAIASDVAVTATIKYSDIDLGYDVKAGAAVGLLAAVPEATATGLAATGGFELSVGESAILSSNTAFAGIVGAVATTCKSGGCGPAPKENGK